MRGLITLCLKNIEYTRHAKNRMRWRKISKKEVEMVIKEPEKIEGAKEKRKNIYGSINGKYIRVSCAFEGDKLIIISAVDKRD